jgi:hypothetical protein
LNVMQTTEEIPHSELHRYTSELNEALEAVCVGSAFRTSPKSCEFLRHIVHYTLNDDIAQLKERLIGMTLLGREASYDTGSDAGVRVRANDVRKRLIAHYTVQDASTRFTFDLPAGSYVPRFFRRIAQSTIAPPVAAPLNSPAVHHEAAPPLSLQWLAAPTLVALFLCTICLRWQIAQEHPFTTFWLSVFQNHHVTLYLSPSKTDGGQDLVAMQELKAADPLFNLAGQFHTRFTLTSTLAPAASASDILVSIGSLTSNTLEPETASEHTTPPDSNRLTIENTPAGRMILDRDAPDPHRPISSHAALLTIANGAQRSIHIDGTDNGAIESLVEILCERDSFPISLADAFQDRSITQIVFPLAPHADALIFHESLPMAQNSPARIR